MTDIDQSGRDPDTLRFTPALLHHAAAVGFTLEQMRAAVANPRWVNVVRRDNTQPTDPLRLRYCGHGVAVVVEGHVALAVIADDETKQPVTSAQAIPA